MSLAEKAARGALWTVISSIGGRAVGVVGTLVMTRFLMPDEMGEVAAATVLAGAASWITIWGFGQYAVVYGRGSDAAEVTWHATVGYIAIGAVSLGLMAVYGGRLLPYLNMPGAAVYVPGMALAMYIRRIGAMPERVLARQMKFRASGMALLAGELSYTVVALSLAAMGHGAFSIVIANIVQSCVMVAILIKAAGFASWATPTPLRMARFKSMLRYGVPLAVQNNAASAARYWDRLAIGYYFNTSATGAYTMAYNLADVPAVQVGEQITLVLMPSMAELPRERRPRALERATALLSLVIFPLAVGLGFIAGPLVALLLPGNKWQAVGPLLTVLACLSIFRPIKWVLSAYMEAESKTSRLMVLELANVVLLLGGIALLARFGLLHAASAVGISFGCTAIAGVALVSREGPSATRLLVAFVQPLAACGVMGLVVWMVRSLLHGAGLDHPAIHLVFSIVTGAAAYMVAALLIARDTSRDLLGLVRQAMVNASRR